MAKATDNVSDRPDPIEAGRSDPADSSSKPAGPDALAAVFKQLAEAVEYLAYLLATQIDRVKLKIRNLVLLVILGAIGAVAGLALVFCTVWLLLSGIAGGLGELLGDRPWLGGIIVSAVILIVGGLACWIVYRRVKSSGLKSIRRRYEERQAKQRARFGREVEQAADERK
jgi:hypothetical protein